MLLLVILAAALNHALNNGGGSPSLELWQVINLLGSIALARLLLPPVIED